MNHEADEKWKKRQRLMKALSLVSQISLTTICPILILLFAGIALDNRFGNGHHWFVFAGIVIGLYAAYRNTYLLIRDNFLNEKDSKKEDESTDRSGDRRD